MAIASSREKPNHHIVCLFLDEAFTGMVVISGVALIWVGIYPVSKSRPEATPCPAIC